MRTLEIAEIAEILRLHAQWRRGESGGQRANLSGADLTGAALPPAPIIPDIHRRVYEAAAPEGALDMREWHTCETTHCRAGWVVTLAGEAGLDLESQVGSGVAAALIYMASDPTLSRIPDWAAGDAEALSDMKRLAEAGVR